MPRIDPLPREELPEHEGRYALVEQAMGFVPNSMFTMPRVPGLLEGFQQMAGAALYNELIPNDLKQMIALATSAAAGCQYCQAHTGHTAHRVGASEEKLAAVWEYEASPLFSDAERAALRLAFHAGQVPNQATDADFVELKKHWTDDQIAAIVAVISTFGFLNRWNDTMATSLETSPIEFGERVLSVKGWDQGNH